MKRASTLLLFDLNNHLWKSIHAYWALRHGDRFTGGLYGVLMALARAINESGARRVVVGLDVKPYVRCAEYPAYKVDRKRVDDGTREAYADSIAYVHAALQAIGLPPLGVTGFECDDIIARLAEQERHRYARVVASSGDSDLDQVMRWPNFSVMRKDLAHARDAFTLYAETGLSPEQFVVALALSGTHNNIDGIPGIGPGRAAKAVHDPVKMAAILAEHGALVRRNLGLIRLPHKDLPPIRVPAPLRRFDPRAFYRFCGEFGIRATPDMTDAFDKVTR